MERGRRILALSVAWALPILLGSSTASATPPGEPGATGPPAPRAYLIYLIDGADPIVVKRYVEEDGQIRFEKYGGWIGIPRYEVLRIVPDEPSPLPEAPPAPAEGADARLYVTTRQGATLRATALGEEGARVRVRTAEGSITMPRADVVGVLRIPAAPALPEAWLTLVGGNGAAGAPGDAAGRDRPPADGPGAGTFPRLSDRPHLLQLADGVVLQIDGFWIEDGQIHFRRLGGVVGFALSEVSRLLPQDVAPADGRVPAQFVRRLGVNRFEAWVGREVHRIRLIGIDPVAGATSPDDPWRDLARGLVLQLEFDRQRYETGGDWLAYAYLPSGRMLNAELIRAGLARPRSDGRNLRYLDLFQEITAAGAVRSTSSP